MKFNRSSNKLQAFAAKCLIRMIANEEDAGMRALYLDYLKELEAAEEKPSASCPVFVSRRGRVI